MIMCVLLCYPLAIHMSQLLSTGRPISSYIILLILQLKALVWIWMQVWNRSIIPVDLSHMI